MDPKGAKVSDKISDFAGNRAFWENVLLGKTFSVFVGRRDKISFGCSES